jgi:hypothetical protein
MKVKKLLNAIKKVGVKQTVSNKGQNSFRSPSASSVPWFGSHVGKATGINYNPTLNSIASVPWTKIIVIVGWVATQTKDFFSVKSSIHWAKVQR